MTLWAKPLAKVARHLDADLRMNALAIEEARANLVRHETQADYYRAKIDFLATLSAQYATRRANLESTTNG